MTDYSSIPSQPRGRRQFLHAIAWGGLATSGMTQASEAAGGPVQPGSPSGPAPGILGAAGAGQVRISDEVLPWTWVSFLVAVVTGVLLFMGQATNYLNNNEFRVKMVLMALAGVNLAIFHFFTWSRVKTWNDGVQTPVGAKVAALLSLSLWAGVVIAGRWIGWTLTAF